jgi:hypothetical protein
MSVGIETVCRQVAEKQFLSTGDVAAITGWTIQKVRTLCEQGKLPAVNTSTATRPRWTIRRCDLDAFLTPKSVAKVERQNHVRRRIDAHVPKVFG